MNVATPTLTERERTELRRLRKVGVPVKEIAQRFKIGCSAVSYYAGKESQRRARITKQQREAIVRLYDAGMKLARIARLYGVHPTTVAYHAHKAGSPPRKRK